MNNNIEQLKLIAVRLLNGNYPHIRKNLIETQPYYLHKDYKLEPNASQKEFHDITLKNDSIPADFFSSHTPRISISAIVGKNGSGKSALIDIVLRTINNYSYRCLKNYNTDLKWINGLRVELYFIVGTTHYQIRQNGDKESDIKLYNYDLNISKWIKMHDNKKVLSQYFYSIVMNYSLYAFNTLDYKAEWEVKDNESSCWLKSLFHKNDGYQTPVVINPMRTKGEIDINNENYLAKNRLISLFFSPPQGTAERFVKIDTNNIVDHLTIKLNKEHVYDKSKEIRKEWFEQRKEDESFFSQLENIIWNCWVKLYNLKENEKNDDEEFQISKIYLIYKTISVAQKYNAYDNFDCLTYLLNEPWDDKRILKVHDLISEMAKDNSHITYKIKQTLAFLKFRHYTAKGTGFIYTIDDFSRIVTDKIKDGWRYIDFVPAPCFVTEIMIKNTSTVEEPFAFSMLSSGQRQLIYMASSVLYHIRNVNSVKGTLRRVKYSHINIIMDEIELYFHPEYQRQTIYYLIKCIESLAPKEIKSINIIMATHSPFILSDIPDINVLFMESGISKDAIMETFGGNIHSLYKHSFFIDDMPIGEFAKTKILNLFSQVRTMDKSNVKVLEQINLIGDYILRSQLVKLYNDKFGSDVAAKIKSLEDEICQLKKYKQ